MSITNSKADLIATNPRVFADNTAAAALATNTIYRTATGVLMIKY